MANLEDLIDPEYGLQQDEWSLTRPRFGAEGQLEVIGWSGRSAQRRKFYLLRCDICARDEELFGRGIFKSHKNNLDSGQIPCACSKRYFWSEEQILVRLQRKLVSTPSIKFNKFLGYEGINKTRCELECEKHGAWQVLVTNILRRNSSCPGCNGGGLYYDVDAAIKKFLKTGQFAEGTEFRKIRKEGVRNHWEVFCPVCETTGKSFASNLLKGYRCCSCGTFRQKEAYINLIKEDFGYVAVKLGIANKSEVRLLNQNSCCIYEVENFGVWEFETKKSCLAAERECKQTLECGILTREEMPDGYTETTWLYNLDKIISIYEKHGGKRIK